MINENAQIEIELFLSRRRIKDILRSDYLSVLCLGVTVFVACNQGDTYTIVVKLDKIRNKCNKVAIN